MLFEELARVSEAVGKVFEVGTVAGGGDDVACRGVDRFQRRAGLRGGERGVLRVAHDTEHLVHLLAGFAEHERARDVGLVALHRAAVVDHDDRPFADRLRRHRAVRQRGERAGLHGGLAGKSDAAVRERDQIGHLVLRHPGLQGLVNGLVHIPRRGVGELHQL